MKLFLTPIDDDEVEPLLESVHAMCVAFGWGPDIEAQIERDIERDIVSSDPPKQIH